MNILIAGINGYFGGVLGTYLLDHGYKVYGVDRTARESDNIPFERIDLSKPFNSEDVFRGSKIDVLIDLATEIDFAVDSKGALYNNNVNIAVNLLNFCHMREVGRYIYLSSNSIYLGNVQSLIRESDIPLPTDEYGKSKWEVEKFLFDNSSKTLVNVIRCPNIIDSGRVGMLSILFELLESQSTIWVLGKGSIRHQCIYAKDLCSAIVKLFSFPQSDYFNIGSDNVPSFKEMYAALIEFTGSKSKIRSVPEILVIPALKILYALKLSPMGPYQFRMLTKQFIFDTTKIKRSLDWQPSKNNIEMLQLAFNFYVKNKSITRGSANKAPVKSGLLSLLKYIKL
jgi:UDP-glucose 4-epimerase